MYLNYKNYEKKYIKYKNKYKILKSNISRTRCTLLNGGTQSTLLNGGTQSTLLPKVPSVNGGNCDPLPNPEEEDFVSRENLLDLCPEERITIQNKCYDVKNLYEWIIKQKKNILPSTQTVITVIEKKRLIKAYNALPKIPNILTRDKLIELYPQLELHHIIEINDINYTDISVNTFNNLPSLSIILIHGTKIKHLGGMSEFQLSDVPLEGIFNNLPRLWNLNLSHNQIQTINSLSHNLPNLRSLSLSHNKINKLQLQLFSNLPKLEHLYLENNQIQELQLGLFDNLSELNTLRLNNNNIITLQQDLFINLSSLKELYLNNNLISGIENTPYIFSNLLNLEILHLENNLIKELAKGIFNNLLNLRSVHIYDNQIEQMHNYSYYGLPNQFIMI